MQVSGHVRKRESKDNILRYQIIIELPRDNKTGKRKRIYKTVDGNKKHAEKIMRSMMDELENNTYVKENKITVGKWIEEWFELYISNKSPTTQRGYKDQIDSYILPRFESVLLQELSSVDIQKWVNELYEKSPATGRKLKEKTVKNIFLNLQSCCEKAVKLKMISHNPCKEVELKPCKKYEATVYDRDEVEQLIEALKGEEIELPILVTLFLGLRRGELLGLHWSDIDFENKVVHIHRNLVLGKGKKLVEKEPKSKSGNRRLPLSDNLISMLQKHRRKYCENKILKGVGYKDNDYVFCDYNGMPFRPDTFSNKYIRFLNRKGLKHIRFHDLRHTSCTLLLSQGITMKTLQKRLGHSTYNTTADIYSHVLTTDEMIASCVADEIIFSKMG